MQMNTPPRNIIRLTRRGRAALIATGAVVAAAAVAVPLLSVQSGDSESDRPTTLVIPEGWRATQVYNAVDRALDLPDGATEKSLAKARLTLPADAEGNPEGYLFPATYPLDKRVTPEALLTSMVETANRKFGVGQVTAGAQHTAMNVYQAVTIASIIQAEAATREDMGRVSRVVFNRLERGMPLQMDSTLNYALNRSTLDTSVADTKIKSPYNLYQRMGLPPTPIANPGEEAMRAATNPPPGDWLYFVTVKQGDTRFTADYEEHLRNVAEFNQNRKAGSSSAPPSTAPPATHASPAPPATHASPALPSTASG